MAKITVRDNGPLLIEDEDATVCDMSGGEFSVQGGTFALCRCGASEKKPFCDGPLNKNQRKMATHIFSKLFCRTVQNKFSK